MNLMKCYSQDPSFDITEHGTIDVEEAISLLCQFPRLPAVSTFREGVDLSRPMIGFQDDSGAFIEFAVDGCGSFHGRFEQPDTKRMLGIEVKTIRDIETVDVSIDFGESLVRLFFAKDWSVVYDRMKSYKRS